MNVIATEIPDVLIIKPRIYKDKRGCFIELYNSMNWSDILGSQLNFVQDNCSVSKKDVLRGLHYQSRNTQGKLIQVCRGSIYDVVVDLRIKSKTFGKWAGRALSSENCEQLWVPPGFAHGFLTLSDEAVVIYKVTNWHDPESEISIRWDDSHLAIDWPLQDKIPVLSKKDSMGLSWQNAPKLDLQCP